MDKKRMVDSSLTEIDSSVKFRVTESYKAIRTNLIFSLMKKGCKTVVISSPLPSEGKSTSSVNIAISLAQTDMKVLLIDTDLRKPKIHRFLNINNVPGLTNYLGGMNALSDIIHQTKYPNLHVICSGTTVPNPSEMLASEQMQEFIEKLKEQYDSTPLNIVSDALPLIKNSDGLILMIRENSSTYTELDKALNALELIDAKVLGIVLNGAQNSEHAKYNYSYKYESKG